MQVGAAFVMAAPDPVACWGAAELMHREYGLPITAITGPATDNEVGNAYITAELRLAAHYARLDASGLVGVVKKAIEAWEASGRGGVVAWREAGVARASQASPRAAVPLVPVAPAVPR
jgi:hypothetical protein